MKSNNKRSLPAGGQGGFLMFIIIIIVAVLALAYFHISLSQIMNWFVNVFQTVFK